MDNSYRIFAVVSEPRTGSTVISQRLGMLDNVACQGEIFHPDRIYCSVDKRSIPDIIERNRDPIGFMHRVLKETNRQKGPFKLIGFKIFFDHNSRITEYLIENKIPVVVLERCNKLAQYSSLKIAKKTGQWNSKQKISHEQKIINRKIGKKVRFSLLEFVAFSIRSRYRFYHLIKVLNKNRTPFYYLVYENMFNHVEWQKMVDFLDIDAANINVESTLKKQNRGDLFSRFSNTRYASFCCRVMLMFPALSKFFNITQHLLGE